MENNKNEFGFEPEYKENLGDIITPAELNSAQAPASTPFTDPIQPEVQPTPAFAQPVQQDAQATSPFAQPVQQDTQATSPFAQPVQQDTQATSPFVQPVQQDAQATSPFAQPVQQDAQATSPFAQPVQQNMQSGVMGMTPVMPKKPKKMGWIISLSVFSFFALIITISAIVTAINLNTVARDQEKDSDKYKLEVVNPINHKGEYKFTNLEKGKEYIFFYENNPGTKVSNLRIDGKNVEEVYKTTTEVNGESKVTKVYRFTATSDTLVFKVDENTNGRVRVLPEKYIGLFKVIAVALIILILAVFPMIIAFITFIVFLIVFLVKNSSYKKVKKQIAAM